MDDDDERLSLGEAAEGSDGADEELNLDDVPEARGDDEDNAEIAAGQKRLRDAIEIGTGLAGIGRPRAPHERVTTPYLTKYERARILGTRANQIAHNAPVMVPIEGEVDPLIIAAKELQRRVLPIVIRRRLPDGTYEDWGLEELEIEPDRNIDDRYTNV